MNDPVIHLMVGAQFGDLEYDVGKSVRWSQFYCDDLHITDINLGTQRFWVVNWAATFPTAEFDTVGVNFFYRPTVFRQEQWRLANDAHKARTGYEFEDDDWVLWVDAHEGLSFDNRSLPDDYESSPFRAWVYREVTRAETASRDYAVIPFYVFCKSNEIQNVEFASSANDAGAPTTYQMVSVPTYVDTNQGLVRLMKVSRLRNPAFNWASIDQLQAWLPTSATVPAVKMQIISYAYCHWQYMDIVDPEVGIPDLDESNDEGWKMRKEISMVRPVAGFPVLTWNPDDQPAGLHGPWCVDAIGATNPDIAADVIPDKSHTAPHAKMEGLRTPLYDTVFRIDLRDGVWYEEGQSGNIPLAWDPVAEDWITYYVPEEWSDKGIESSIYSPIPDPPPPPPEDPPPP